MSTLVTPQVAWNSRAAVLPWLPAPWRALPEDAACPTCGALGEGVYSIFHHYVCCTACGWQRRLLTRDQRLAAALAATLTKSWASVLDDLAKCPPDPLPPVPALLWHPVAGTTDVWQGPSRGTPNMTRTVDLTRSGLLHCTCPNLVGTCWHRKRARELSGLPLPDPATAAADLWG